MIYNHLDTNELAWTQRRMSLIIIASLLFSANDDIIGL